MNAKEYREKLAEQFLNVLQEKGLQFMEEWSSFKSKPVNAKRMLPYKGINMFRLFMISQERGYTDPRWATFNQIKDMGCRLKNAKGQGVTVEYWYPWNLELKRAATWEEYYKFYHSLEDKSEIEKTYSLRSKYSVVFNGDLIEGLPELAVQPKRDIVEDEIIPKLSKELGVELLNDGRGRAYYSPNEDKIHLPERGDFVSDYAYNSVALHEFGHATGAAHRLNRDLGGGFGTERYAYEELIAEITSCFMSVNLKTEQDAKHIENHKAYVQSWIKSIKEKPEMLVKAIAQAEKATAYLEEKAGIITIQEYMAVEQSTMEVSDEQIEQEVKPEPENHYYMLPEGRTSMERKPIELWVGNLAKYTEGRLEGEWIGMPIAPDKLQEQLNRISRNGADEIMIMDVSLRSDCTYLKDFIEEWTNIGQVNMVAGLIGDQQHPAVEAYCEDSCVSNLSELANALLQEESIPFYGYKFEGSDHPEVMKNLNEEEKYGYTMIESNPELKKILDSIPLGTSTLGSYVDAGQIGKDMSLSGDIVLHENGWLDKQAEGPNLALYTVEELVEEAFGYSKDERPLQENVTHNTSITDSLQNPRL